MSTSLLMLILTLVSTMTFVSIASAEEQSAATFSDLDSEVGCNSKYQPNKKREIFESKYLGRRMTWEGVIFSADTVSVLVNVDGSRFEDLSAKLRNPVEKTALIRGKTIQLSFVMKSLGSCYLPFAGTDAIIINQPQTSREDASTQFSHE